MRSHASALAMVFSKSLASRRLRPNQAKVRSMTQRLGLGSGLNVPTCSDRVDDLDRPFAEFGDGARSLVRQPTDPDWVYG